MRKALISPNQLVETDLGHYLMVVEVSDTEFPVAPPLVWKDCPPEVEVGWGDDGTSFVLPKEPEIIPEPTARPTYDEITHIVEEAPPVLVDGVWYQQWNIVALPAEQAAQNQAEKDHADSIDLARTQAKADGFVQQFVAMTPAQVSTYVADNVNTLADAKNLLAKLALMMLAIAKEQYK